MKETDASATVLRKITPLSRVRIFIMSLFTLGIAFLSYLFFQGSLDYFSFQHESYAAAPESYEARSGCEKQSILWSQIEETEYDQLPRYSRLGLTQFLRMSLQELRVKGELFSDFAPRGWRKYIHRRGSMAKVKIVSHGNHPYTGVFEGAECALMRLSLTFRPSSRNPVAPGLALKVLRDGMHSANISALYSLEGQGQDYNFFRHAFSNIVPQSQKFGQRMVHSLFKKVTDYPEELLMDDFGHYVEYGAEVLDPLSPRQIFFVPGPELGFSSDPHDVREDFHSISEGTLLYKVYAVSESKRDFDYRQYTSLEREEFLAQSEHIADIITTSPMLSSAFGDEGIFFRHQLRAKKN